MVLKRIFKVLVDLIFIRFINNDKSYFYTLGILGLTSFILSAISFIYMIYLKFFEGKSLIETPMPILTVFFALSGLIFFSIIVVIEALKKNLFIKNLIILNLTKLLKKNKCNTSYLNLNSIDQNLDVSSLL